MHAVEVRLGPYGRDPGNRGGDRVQRALQVGRQIPERQSCADVLECLAVDVVGLVVVVRLARQLLGGGVQRHSQCHRVGGQLRDPVSAHVVPAEREAAAGRTARGRRRVVGRHAVLTVRAATARLDQLRMVRTDVGRVVIGEESVSEVVRIAPVPGLRPIGWHPLLGPRLGCVPDRAVLEGRLADRPGVRRHVQELIRRSRVGRGR